MNINDGLFLMLAVGIAVGRWHANTWFTLLIAVFAISVLQLVQRAIEKRIEARFKKYREQYRK